MLDTGWWIFNFDGLVLSSRPGKSRGPEELYLIKKILDSGFRRNDSTRVFEFIKFIVAF
jgi:hypothetical protein